jgi:hypothetical protein
VAIAQSLAPNAPAVPADAGVAGNMNLGAGGVPGGAGVVNAGAGNVAAPLQVVPAEPVVPAVGARA